MKMAAEHFLEKFFAPASVAVVGASSNPLRINHHLLANLVKLGYRGKIYPVHPKVHELLGLKTYPSILLIDEPVDLAVIAVPHDQTFEVLKDCVKQGIKRVVIVAGGFSETGPKGKKVQEQMAQLLRENGVKGIGPNALSPINVCENFAVSFHPIDRIKPGGLSLIFQSGLYEPRLHWLLSEHNLHLNKLIDLGNKMDVNEVDALSYLAADPQTRVIGIHLESIEGDGRTFLRLIREAVRDKSVVVLKSGRTPAGAKAAASHTGVMVQGSDIVFDAALRQCGALRVRTIEEFFMLGRALERFGPLSLNGDRIVIATLPGGEGVIVTDLCQQEGLSLARVGEQTLQGLAPVFPTWEVSANPFDLGVCLQFHDPIKVYDRLVQSMTVDPHVDAMAVQVAEWSVGSFPKEFFEVFRTAVAAGKPIALWVPGIEPGRYDGLVWLEEQGVPVFPSAAQAIMALAALRRASLHRSERCPSRES